MKKKKINQQEKQSIEKLKKLIEENQDSSIAYFQLAEIYRRRAEYSQAGTAYLSYALRVKEINKKAANEILKKAKIFFEKSLEKNPNDSDSCSKLACVYSYLGKSNKAIQIFNRAIKISRSPWDYFYLAKEYLSIGEILKAAENFMIAGKEDQKKDGGYFNRGILAFEEAAAYKKIIKINPHMLKEKDYFNLGYACFYCSKYSYEEAINAFEKAICLNPENEEAYYYLALSYEENCDHKSALKILKKLIEINPKHRMVYHKMYSNYEKLGDNKKAKEYLKKALIINPSYHFNLLRLLSILTERQPNQKEETVKLYKEALELRPDYAPGHYDLGELYLSFDDLKNAKYEYEILKNLDKNIAGKLRKLIKHHEQIQWKKKGEIQ